MKKALLTLSLLAGLLGIAQAQNRANSIGLKAGGSLSDFVGTDASAADYQSIYGFHAGVFATIGIAPMVAFQPELLYSQKGAKTKTRLGEHVSERLHYVDVPLAFHINANGLFFEVGPQAGFLVAAQDVYGSSSATISRDNFSVVDFGYLAGLGYQHKTGPGVGLRYNSDFTNYRRPITLGNTSFQTRSRNSIFQLYLTYSFNGR